MDINVQKLGLAKIQSKYQSIALERISAREKFEEARLNARCQSCPIGQNDLKKDFFERFSDCESRKECTNVNKAYQKLASIKKKENLLLDDYAEKVYTIFSDIKPTLKQRADASVISWDDAFKYPFTSLGEEDKISLVALIENDGGKYRLV